MEEPSSEGADMAMTGAATIGIITAGPGRPIEGFKAGLRELGYIEGENIRFAQRTADGDLSRLPALAAEIVQLNVELVAVIGAVTARAVQSVTATVPIIYSVVVDPVSDGLAVSMEKPGGNMTGVTSFDPNQARTHVELLRSVAPALDRVAILSDQGVSDCLSASNFAAARDLGVDAQVLRLAGPKPDFDSIFAAMEGDGVGGVVVLEEPVIAAHRTHIAELARTRRLPTVFPREQVDAGGLFCYGTSLRSATQRMAQFARRVLDGISPSELPVEKLSRHELVVNQKTARKLGLVVPSAIIHRAVEVID